MEKKIKTFTKNALFSSLILLLFSFACSSTPKSSFSNMAMQFPSVQTPEDWLGLSKKWRKPAGTDSDKNLYYYQSSYKDIVKNILAEAALPASVANPSPHKALGRYLETVSQVYMLSLLQLKRFDTELERLPQNKTIFDIPAYKDLLKTRIVNERIQNQIIFVIKNLLIMESQPRHPNYLQAHKLLQYTRGIWEHIAKENGPSEKIIFENKARRLIFQPLFSELEYGLREYLKEFNATNPHAPAPIPFMSTIDIIHNILLDNADEQRLFKELRTDIIELAEKNEFKGDTWLNIAKQDIDLDSALSMEQKSVRAPQAVQNEAICPDSGPAGNITGDHFPKGTWTVTVDDGPHKTYTNIINDAFQAGGIKGSFFWLASLVPQYEDIVNQMKAAGHTLGVHSFSHANLPTLKADALHKEIVVATEIEKKAYGFQPKFFRCPYGACGPRGGTIRTMIKDLNMVHVFWNIDSLDWKDKDPDSIIRRVMLQYDQISPHSGGIILFHDVHSQSAAAVTKLVPILQKKGIILRNLEEIVTELNAGKECPTHWTPGRL